MKPRYAYYGLAILLSFCLTVGVTAQDTYQPAPENLAARQWFQDAKFGLFIHWGIYAVPGGEWKGKTTGSVGEWLMNTEKIPVTEYEKIAAEFNPTAFDPALWVRLAKQAGMKYITITSKHHDGFALWDSKVSDWDVIDRTPYQKDILKMLADECEKEGLKLFFYHSQLDWHHPDYFPRGQTGQDTGRPDTGEFNKYLDYMDAQLAELLGGRYGKIGGIWFDGWWDQQSKARIKDGGNPKKTTVNWRLDQTYELIHKLQPQALIGNNHHVPPFDGEDFQMFEKDLPGQNSAGFNADAKIGALPLEMCDTTNNSWGYKKNDKNFKPLKTLVGYLVGAAGRNSNLLLNIGPQPNGEFPPAAVKQLQELSTWTAQYGAAVYGTRGGPVAPQNWGVTTQKGSTVYVHVLDHEAKFGESIVLTGLTGRRVTSAKLMNGGKEIKYDAAGQSLSLPRALRVDPDTVIVLETEGEK